MSKIKCPACIKEAADEKWIQKAVPESHKGNLHRALGIPEDQKIPASRIAEATKSDDPHLRRMALLAQNFAKIRRKK